MRYLDDIKYYKTPLELDILLSKIYSNRSLHKIFKHKKIINRDVNREISLRLKGDIENFVTILIIGEQGSLKSTCGQEIAKRTDKNFSSNNISLFYADFRNKISGSQAGQTFILDEMVFLHGTGSNRLIDEIQTTIETLRKRKNSLIIIAVESKYFPEEIFTFTMETLDKCLLGTCKSKSRLHEIRSCKEKKHVIKKAFVRLAVKKKGIYLGLYIQEIRWGGDLWNEYEIIKDAFLKKVVKQDFVKLNFKQEAEKIRLMPESNSYQSVKELKLFLEMKKPNLTVAEKELLALEIKLQREEFKNKAVK